MNIKIYQIDCDKDTHNVKFADYERLEKYQGTKEIDSAIYSEVYSGEVDANDLEDVFRIFNTVPVGLHRGHSLIVSDIVQTDEGYFFCDRVGFKKVDFDSSLAYKPDNLIKVLYVEPNKPAVVGEMIDDYKAIQKAVQGRFEQVHISDDAAILCNDEGKLNGMKGNRHYAEGQGIIAGPFVIVGCGRGDSYESLSDEQIEKYMQEFGEPEDISDEETMSDAYIKVMHWG